MHLGTSQFCTVSCSVEYNMLRFGVTIMSSTSPSVEFCKNYKVTELIALNLLAKTSFSVISWPGPEILN